MALSRQNLINAPSADNFGTGAFTSTSFTPRANSRMLILGYAIEESADAIEGGNLTAADSLALGLTPIIATAASPGWGYGIRAWLSDDVGGSPASRTIALDCGATNVHAYRLWVDDITGIDTTTQFTGAVVGSDADGDGAAALTLAASPTVDDIIYAAAIGGISSGSPTMTPGAGFTELLDALSTGWANWHLQTVTGVTSTNVPWADLNAGAGTNLGATLLAFTIKNAAAGGGGNAPRAAYNYRLRRAA